MKKRFDKPEKIILLGFTFLVIGLCSYLLTIRIAQEIDYAICKTRVAKELNITSTDEIYKTLNSKIGDVVEVGMTSENIRKSLEKIYPVYEIEKWVKMDGETAEHLGLNTCNFKRNNWKFLFIYSKEGQLEEFHPYIND